MEEQKQRLNKQQMQQQEENDFIDDEDLDDEEQDEYDNYNDDDDDDEEDNYDEDEDYDENYGKNKKRKAKGQQSRNKSKKQKKKEREGVNKFFESEASEAEDDEISEQSEEGNNQDRQKELKLLEEMQKKSSLKEQYRKVINNLPEDETQLKEYFDKKYQYDQDEIPEDLIGQGNDEIVEQYQLPSNRDPKIFAVKCRMGQERETVAGILNKFIYYNDKPQQKLEIHSAAFIDKFPGYIYIEAEKEGHVRQAVKGFRSLEFSMGQNQIQVMAIDQVPLIYTCDGSKQIDIQTGQWIRVKKGPYENDLGQILNFDESKTSITIKLIPRISDYQEDQNENTDPSNRGAIALKKQRLLSKKNIRPEQKLFVASNYKNVETQRNQGVNEKQGFSQYYKNMHFVNGFLHKKMNIKNIEYKNIEPTLEEVQFFIKGEKEEQDKQKLMDEALAQIQKVKDKINKFQKGDKVKVIEGDLKNLIGIVSNTDQNEVTIIAEGVGITDAMNFKPSELVKYFKIGDYVKITEGKYKGQCGPIIKIDDFIATVVTEGQKSEVKCLINNLQATAEINSEVQNHKNQKLQKFDLIKLFNNDTGCVVLRLGNENLTVLDDQGQQQIISYFQIDQKIHDKNISLRNRFQQNITINSTVKITDGVYKNKSGTVKHIYNNTLFLYNTEFIDTVGIFVENANNCYLVTSNLNQRKFFQPQVNKEGAEAQDRPPFNQQDINNQPKEKNPTAQPNKDPIIGKSVTIRKGPYKGYEGIIKAADDRSVRIELAAKCRIIQLPRDVVLDDSNNPTQPEQIFQQQALGSQTPQILNKLNPQSPFVGGQSPAFMASPGWGFAANSPAYKIDQQQ